MPLYLCRWPNGDLSAVQSKDKDDAIWLLDEVGSARPAYLSRCSDFMVHFRLSEIADPEVGEAALLLELEDFGEDCIRAINGLYPKLSAAFARDEADEASYRAGVNAALAEERIKPETTKILPRKTLHSLSAPSLDDTEQQPAAEIEKSGKQNASRARTKPNDQDSRTANPEAKTAARFRSASG
jgi:hypothetical protein